jgi:hypothetical protein
MSYYNRTKPVSQPVPTYYNRTKQVSHLLPNEKIITESKLSDIAELKLNEIMKHLTNADRELINHEATISDKKQIINAGTDLPRIRYILSIIKLRKSTHSPDHNIELIFNEKWIKKHNSTLHIFIKKDFILNQLLDFFELKGLPSFTLHQNIEVWNRAYLHTKDIIKQHTTRGDPYYLKLYLDKLKDIYIYKITNTIEKIHKSKEENTILDKINFFAYIEESSSTITTCEICYELYKIVYNYIKKYIRKNYENYPKFTKEEYLTILQQTYKLKLENCRNKFNITSIISTKSSSSSLGSSSSHSPPKAKEDRMKRTLSSYQNFVREHFEYLRQKEAEDGVKTTAKEKMKHIATLWKKKQSEGRKYIVL